MTLALIDGDILAYRAAYGTGTETYDWGDTGGKVSIENPQGAAEEAVKLVSDWASMVFADGVIVCLTGREKFRKRVLPSYQANRGIRTKTEAHVASVRAMKDAYPFHLIEGLEADDVMGILATRPKYRGEAIIVSIDKDMRTVPCRLFNPDKDTEVRAISEAEANYWWMYQTLVGDSSDGYKGCPKMGPVGAAKLLPGWKGREKSPYLRTLWSHVLSAYRKAKLTEDDAITQARMARILRNEDYDRKTKEIILWHPTTPMRIPLEPVSVEGLGAAPDPPAQSAMCHAQS